MFKCSTKWSSVLNLDLFWKQVYSYRVGFKPNSQEKLSTDKRSSLFRYRNKDKVCNIDTWLLNQDQSSENDESSQSKSFGYEKPSEFKIVQTPFFLFCRHNNKLECLRLLDTFSWIQYFGA